MRLVPCSWLPWKGLKFSTRVGLPESPWIVSVPLPVELPLVLPPQALTATRANAIAATQKVGNLACGRGLVVGSPRRFRPVDSLLRASERTPARGSWPDRRPRSDGAPHTYFSLPDHPPACG